MSQPLKYKEAFNKILQSKLPFVLYKKPEEDEVYGLIQKDNNLWFVQDFEKEKGFVFSPYNNEKEKIILKSDAKIIFDMDDLDITMSYKKMDVNGLFSDGVKQINPETNKQKYLDLVNNAKKNIIAGTIDKVVISREELWEAQKVDFSAIFKDLINTYNDAFIYIWFHPQIGMWIGATPELLLERDDQYIHSVALAGTRKLNADNKKINWGEKEKVEHEMVSKYVKSIFERNLLTNIQKFAPETVEAGNIEHIKTDITGELSDNSDVNYLLRSLHPTPAVCGFPLKKAQEFIDENEGYDRDFYTGYLGELNIENHTELYVNLRCLQVQKKGVKFFAGGGITNKSMAEDEWDETESKLKTLKDIVLNHLS